MKYRSSNCSRWIAADNPTVDKHNAIELELREFCQAIVDGHGNGVTFDQGARAVEVASRIMDQIVSHE